MALVVSLILFLIQIYMFVLIARLVVDWIQVFAREWRPRGLLLVIIEGIYSLTDPPLKALRRVIPPVRLGSVMLDLGFIVLWFGLYALSAAVTYIGMQFI
ncbi:YggT family protein [Gephyromycinifex aptenodytis]|uniref:YggT family protein n=1 Tax=Gephyromycinifex aptenodytis TaxID=2716227 RepID=UPI001448360B|nr:YggT family protein [Gephyromycinifex aptenodytis]